MKKLFGVLIGFSFLANSVPAQAELFKSLSLSGALDVRATSADNALDLTTAKNDHIGNVQTRTILNISWDLLDDVHANLTLRKNDRTWGSRGGNSNPIEQNNQSLIGNPSSGRGILDNLFVQQANVKIDKIFGFIDAKIGRQYFGDPDDFVVHYGPKNWYGLPVTAIDAFRLDQDNDWVKGSALFGQTAGCVNNGGTNLAAACANQDVAGINTWIKGLPVQLGPFLWNRQIHSTGDNGTPGGKNDNLWVYGARIKAEGMGAWVQANIGFNSGENRLNTNVLSAGPNGYGTSLPNPSNYQGRAIEFKAGYKADIPNVAMLAPSLTFAMGSGRNNKLDNQNKNFQSISNSPSYGFIYGYFGALSAAPLGSGLATGDRTYDGTSGLNSLGNTNREVIGLTVKAIPSSQPKLTAGFGYWQFRYQHATTAYTPNAGLQNVQVGQGNRHIGDEVDISLEWKHSDNVAFILNLGDFLPGGFLKETAKIAGQGVNSTRVAMLDTRIRF